MSSRNRYLSAAERRKAPKLHDELKRVREALRQESGIIAPWRRKHPRRCRLWGLIPTTWKFAGPGI